jgi:hypothetical protein
MADEREDDREQRIRRKAHQLWEQEGRPLGRDAVHWDMATELVAIEENLTLTTQPVEDSKEELAGQREGEPIEALENAGEFPTLTDQGEQQIPQRRRSTGR